MPETTTTLTSTPLIDSQTFLTHWQGHRGLTRRLIAAFPEPELSTFSVGGMRPFSAMALELADIASAGVRGIATREWPVPHPHDGSAGPKTREAILEMWDATTAVIEEMWPKIPAGRFLETDTAFGQYPGRICDFLLYFVDNEIHHRGQGYVYLRALGVTPPNFYER
jgi:uncharacterized damage-inducible protein DinB